MPSRGPTSAPSTVYMTVHAALLHRHTSRKGTGAVRRCWQLELFYIFICIHYILYTVYFCHCIAMCDCHVEIKTLLTYLLTYLTRGHSLRSPLLQSINDDMSRRHQNGELQRLTNNVISDGIIDGIQRMSLSRSLATRSKVETVEMLRWLANIR